MTNLFENFIQSDTFKLDLLATISCNLVHPFVKQAMKGYFMKEPINQMISNLQAQIASCTANEFMGYLTGAMDTIEVEDNEIQFVPLSGNDMEAVIKNAVAVAFATFNEALNSDLFDDDETANPCH